MTILNDVLRRAKYNLYGDKIYSIFFHSLFCTSILSFNIHIKYALDIAGPFICPQGELGSLLSNFFFLGELTKHVETSMMTVMSRYT